MPIPNTQQTFTRLDAPKQYDGDAMQSVVQDIYNKIAAVKGQTENIPSTIPTTAAITQISTSVASSAAAAAIPSSLAAQIPVVLTNPNSANLQDENGKAVALVDQAVCFWNIGGSDSGLLYQYSGSNLVWSYVSGSVARTQANLTALAGFLGPADTGLLVDVTDFAHILKWTGTAWAYADPSDPAGRIEMFLVDPSPTTGWHLCDGTANVPYLKTDGTTGTQTMPALTATAAYAKLGTPASATLNAPTAPTFTGTPQTFTTQAAQATGTVNAFVSPNPYTPAGTISTTGEPENIILRPWFRL